MKDFIKINNNDPTGRPRTALKTEPRPYHYFQISKSLKRSQQSSAILDLR